MKNLKIAFLSLMVLAVATLGTSLQASAQSTKYSVFTNTFTNGTTIATEIAKLDDLVTPNWNALTTTDPGATSGTKLDNIKISYAAGVPSPDFDATSLQNFFTSLKNYYTSHSNAFPSNGSSFNISAVVNGSSRTYTIIVRLKP